MKFLHRKALFALGDTVSNFLFQVGVSKWKEKEVTNVEMRGMTLLMRERERKSFFLPNLHVFNLKFLVFSK